MSNNQFEALPFFYHHNIVVLPSQVIAILFSILTLIILCESFA